ncbi:dihydroxyacetone kinase subunit DhaK [Acetobacter farinalis]|uniref:Dihydroxyacetone kinase subunit DhaK n=1 Tax=Acetobacter farinalis TaxID=1260984 RepID=A0ABT3Q811_9PROT|nr:dihydroxyacetone kinase subunit DhaK [Acetobacter farinalis]MCX2561427.1 dihydroxyacetone kinase subunit DhaK [Acetobacter farinalis]NHO29995.1 DAK2 domain-containing protein [Acetobacter farinalis]
MKRFFNTRETLVGDSLDGLLRSSMGQHLCRLDGYPDIRVVIRKERNPEHVAIISGGGAGHEPTHAGFVGAGMLDAAICGSVFASPSVDAVLAGILAVTGKAGCLLVIKSYTGDRLNFALAAEQARGMGYQVETVVVGDDIALPDNHFARGLAGTLLVHKIAGHAARQGEPLARVAERARAAAARISSLGLSLSDCNAYDPAHTSRLAADQAELGLGIHGEPGAQQIALADADTLMALAADTLSKALPAKNPPGQHERYGLLLNMLGAVPPIEMTLLLTSFAKTDLAKQVDLIIGPAPMMTALDMNGFSLTAIPLNEDIRTALNAPVEAWAWPGSAPFGAPAVRPLPELPKTFRFPPSSSPKVEAAIRLAAETLIKNKDALNALDAQIGDGDAGSTFAEGAQEILKTIDRLPLAEPLPLLSTIGAVLARHAGGSSGVLLSILFSAAGRSTGPWQKALLEGLNAVQQHGGAKPGDRTMIDALQPALTVLADGGSLADAAQAARAGADATKHMTRANAGRASYVPEAKLANVPDPGAEAVACVFEALARKI